MDLAVRPSGQAGEHLQCYLVARSSDRGGETGEHRNQCPSLAVFSFGRDVLGAVWYAATSSGLLGVD